MNNLRHNAFLGLFSILTLIYLSGCKVKTANPPMPTKVAAVQVNRPLSTLNLPISLEIDDLQDAINNQFKGILYNDNSFENNNDDNLILKVTKISDFKLSAKGDKITIVAPLEVYVKGRLKKDFFSMFDQDFGIDKSKEATFKLDITVNTKLNLNQDWDIITKSEAGFQWREQPYLELGPIKIPIGSIIETVVNNQIADINKKLDAEITKNIKLKPMALQFWNQLQTPIIVSERYQTYLKIVPEFISMSNIKSDGKKIDVNLGFRSDISVISGYKPEPVDLRPLPKLQQQTRSDSTFNLYFNVNVPYTFATELAKKEFVGKEMQFDNGMQLITLNDINFFNNGDKIGMMLDVYAVLKNGIFKKKFKGVVYALGTPVYNDTTQMVSIKNFEFDIKSRDALVGTAEWLLKNNLKKKIEEKLNFPVKDQLEKAQKTADESLNNAKIPGMKLKGKVENIKPQSIKLSEENIQLIIQSTGKINVLLNSKY